MEKVTIAPFKLMGISIKTTNENNQALADITALWQRFMGENILSKIPNRVDDTVYSLYTEYEGDHTQPYRVILGCKVTDLNEIPEGMYGKSFDGGSYVKTSAKGDLMKGLIANHWAKIWEMDLNRTYTADFEVFDERSGNPSNAEVDFYVAINE